MASFRETRDILLHSYCSDLINETEFSLLYDLNKSHNPDFPYWKYPKFDLDAFSEAECKAEFRFYKNDIFTLADLLQIPEKVVCYNGTVVHKTEATCIFLKRFAYPIRYGDMIPRFGRSVPELCMISNKVVDLVYDHFHYKLRDLNQPWLSLPELEVYARAIHDKGAALETCWGFIDGTVRPVCRPGEHQRTLYNGHKRVHAIKFQSLVTPNGLIANLFGPMEGRRHDCALLNESGLLNDLRQYSFDQNGSVLCIYGDPAYPIRAHLLSPFQGARRTPNEKAFNKSMSSVRISVEWIFNDIINYFKFLDFKKNMKIGLSSVGKLYTCCALLHNIRTCMYKNSTSSYFNVDPPEVAQYLN